MSALTTTESARLVECEAVIERGLKTFVEVGEALREVRDSRLYRLGFATFEAYCGERWGFNDSRARQLIAAAETVTTVTVDGAPAPSSERVTRELPREPEAARETWSTAVAEHGERPTARQVAETRERLAEEHLAAPDDVQRGIIEQKREQGGDALAESYAASMGVRCPPAPQGKVVSLSGRQQKRTAAAVKRLRNVVSTCRSIREVADGGIDVEALLAGADDRELQQAVRDIHAAKRELASLERQLAARLRRSA